jgi:hypothetical protein
MAAPCIYYIDGKEFTKEQFLGYVKKSNTTTVKETIDSGIKAIDTKLQTLRDALKDVNSKIDIAAKSDESYAKPTDKDFGKRYNAQANARQFDDVRLLADRRSNIQSEYNRLTDERARIADTYPIKATPPAPFITDTNAWTKLGLKVALKEAVKQGADKIAWTTGTQQFDRWGSEEIHWNTVMKPKGFEIIVKDDAKRPIVRGSRIKSLSSNDGSQDQQSEVKRLAEKWNLKPEDLEVIPSKGQWTLAINEQTDAQAFQGNEEALRSNKLEESDISVGTKAELRDAIKRNLARERNESEIDKLTDRIWNRMQNEDSGTSLPRKEGMEEFYGNPADMERAKNFTIKKEGELFAVKDEKGRTIRTFKQENEANKFKENYGLGIVGNVAKSLFKQELKTVNIEGKKDLKNEERIKYLQHFVDELPQLEKSVSENKLPFTEQELDNSIEKGSITNESYKQGIKQLKKHEESVAKYNEYKERVDEYNKLKFGTTQHSIDITPEMRENATAGQPLFAIAATTTPLIEDIKQTPELSATKETIPTMSFPLELVKIKNMIGSGVKKLGDTVPPSVAVSDYLTKYINKILEYKAYNADGTEKRYAFVGKLEVLRSSLGKASTVPLLNNIYENIINKEPLTKEASGLLNALTEYHIQYNRVQQTNDAIVIDSDTIYNRDEVKDMAMKELTKGKEAVRVKMLENSKYGKPIASFLEKYTLAVSSLPTWAKILAGGENSMLHKLVKALDSAQDKQYVMAETAKSYLSQIQDKISTGSTFNTNDITKSAKEEVGKYFEKYSGIKTKISDGELLHIYLTLKNDQVRARFFKNGYSGVFELKEYRDKNDSVLREHLSIDMTEADYNNLESKFSTPEWSSKIKAWTDANEYLYKYVDQTHREDTGVSLRKADGFYYPLIHGTGISSYEDYLKQNKFVDDLRSAKARSPQVHANYLVVDALQLMNNYVDANTKYASYATPLKNIDVYLKNSDEFFKKNDMMKYVNWYNKFKKEFEDPSPDKMGEIGKRIMSGFVISRLGLNPFVTLKQYSSIFVSNNVIPSKYIVSSLDELAKNAGGVIKSFIPGKTIPFDKTMKEMLEHSATARRRLNAGQNYFDELVKSGIKDYETVVFGKNIKVPFSKMTNNIAAADRAVSALYWVAAKKQVSAETNFTTGSREYWNSVNDIYSKAVIESQSSMDDVNRPHMTKDANILVKGLTLFSGQSFSNFNSFIGNVIEHANNPSKDNKMKVARSIMNIYVYNALMVAAVDSLKYAQNGDDEDKLKKKAFRSLISNSYQNIPIVAPIVDEIWSKVENPRFAREINYPVLQVINDGASLIGNLSNEKFDKAVTDGIKFGAEGIGLPAYPIESVQKIYAK